jgi:hypothetical protein
MGVAEEFLVHIRKNKMGPVETYFTKRKSGCINMTVGNNLSFFSRDIFFLNTYPETLRTSISKGLTDSQIFFKYQLHRYNFFYQKKCVLLLVTKIVLTCHIIYVNILFK